MLCYKIFIDILLLFNPPSLSSKKYYHGRCCSWIFIFWVASIYYFYYVLRPFSGWARCPTICASPTPRSLTQRLTDWLAAGAGRDSCDNTRRGDRRGPRNLCSLNYVSEVLKRQKTSFKLFHRLPTSLFLPFHTCLTHRPTYLLADHLCSCVFIYIYCCSFRSEYFLLRLVDIVCGEFPVRHVTCQVSGCL